MRPSRSRTSAASSAGRGSRRAPLATSKYHSRSRVPRTAPTTQCRYTYRRQIRPLHTYARPFAQQFPRLTSAPTSAAPQRGGGVGAQLLPLPTASSGRAQHSDFLNIGILGGLPAPHANNSDHAKMTPLTNQAPELSISFCRPLPPGHTRHTACFVQVVVHQAAPAWAGGASAGGRRGQWTLRALRACHGLPQAGSKVGLSQGRATAC